MEIHFIYRQGMCEVSKVIKAESLKDAYDQLSKSCVRPEEARLMYVFDEQPEDSEWNKYDPEDESTYPPVPYQLCLVFGKDGMPKIAVYGANNKWYTGQDFVEVSHWLPLPKYPNQKRESNDKRDS